jgi:hypothetical protein
VIRLRRSRRRLPDGSVLIALAAGVLALAAACGGPGRPAASAKVATSSPSPGASASAQPSASPAAAGCPANGQPAADAAQLHQARASATPGAVILLAPGTYPGHFVATVSGTPAAPVTLCGPRDAVIDGGSVQSGYAVHLNGASWWRLVGFTVQGAQKGVVTEHANHVVLSGLYVHGVGDEAIHLRSFSSDDTVQGVVVRDTGHLRTKFGEGIYIGSAHSNWCTYSACGPDASDRDVIRNNDVSQTTAENIDVKEGTTGGVVAGNQLSGVGMDSSAATAWVNVKGNGWTITGNVGRQSVGDGFQVHQVYPGWGEQNVFRANHATVDGPGYGIYVQHRSLATVLACDNTATAAESGLSNISCAG